MAPLGRHAGRWELVGQVLTWSPPTLFCHSAVVTAPGHHVVNVPPIAKFISTWDEPGECGVICKVLEFDRLVSRDAAVGVKGEEQGIKYRSLKATDADALKVCDMHSQSHMLLPVRQEVRWKQAHSPRRACQASELGWQDHHWLCHVVWTQPPASVDVGWLDEKANTDCTGEHGLDIEVVDRYRILSHLLNNKLEQKTVTTVTRRVKVSPVICWMGWGLLGCARHC